MFSLKHQKIITLFVLLLLAGCFLFSLTADAAGIVPCGRNTGTAEEMQPCTLCHLIVGIHRIIDWGFKILTFVAIASLVGAGIMYIISTGNEKMMETAKNLIKHTLMGFAIVLGAWLMVNYTMILLSKKSDLGIGVTSWSEFNCDTSSDLGAEGPITPDTGSGNGSSPAQGELGGACGFRDLGICMEGTFSCPSGANNIDGGSNCDGLSLRCCAFQSQEGGVCGDNENRGECRPRSVSCETTSGWNNNYAPRCANGLKCCKVGLWN